MDAETTGPIANLFFEVFSGEFPIATGNTDANGTGVVLVKRPHFDGPFSIHLPEWKIQLRISGEAIEYSPEVIRLRARCGESIDCKVDGGTPEPLSGDRFSIRRTFHRDEKAIVAITKRREAESRDAEAREAEQARKQEERRRVVVTELRKKWRRLMAINNDEAFLRALAILIRGEFGQPIFFKAEGSPRSVVLLADPSDYVARLIVQPSIEKQYKDVLEIISARCNCDATLDAGIQLIDGRKDLFIHGTYNTEMGYGKIVRGFERRERQPVLDEERDKWEEEKRLADEARERSTQRSARFAELRKKWPNVIRLSEERFLDGIAESFVDGWGSRLFFKAAGSSESLLLLADPSDQKAHAIIQPSSEMIYRDVLERASARCGCDAALEAGIQLHDGRKNLLIRGRFDADTGTASFQRGLEVR